MIIQPKYRGFLCLNAHPAGCAKNVEKQFAIAKKYTVANAPKNVLVIGSSTGYGLSARVMAAANGAATLGVSLEREPADGKTGSAGWYNTAAFEKQAAALGRFAQSINGDAFSLEVKQNALDIIRSHMGKIDLVVYSLASPRRKHPITGEEFRSVIKPIGEVYENRSVDAHAKTVSVVRVEPATEEEVRQTVAVMGGEDWRMWMDALREADLLADNAVSAAFSYIGPELTHAIYTNGTIGMAKKHLEATAREMNCDFAQNNLSAYVCVQKAVVTQASSAIPVVPLYIAILFKVMKRMNLHEDCIEQMGRLFAQKLFGTGAVETDDEGRIRADDWEMREDVQRQVAEIWPSVTTENLREVTDIDGYTKAFFNLFGFEVDGIDYSADVEIV